MSLTSSTQTQIAFKNLLGKSQTKVINGIVNEPYGISFDIPSKNVWLDTIYASASTTIAQGSTVKVTADLVAIPGADNYAFFTKWPSIAPIGNDIKTGLPFQYGVGSLSGLTGGDRMLSLISDSLGSDFEAKPFATGSIPIPVLDDRNWIYQYNSGIFYQDNITSSAVWAYTTPTKIDVYPYIGSKLAVLNTQENIRVTAYGTNSYYATFSTPTIATYSSNYLFLVDFVNGNTSSVVSLNINNIGTVSLVQYSQSGLTPLVAGDITGATGATSGPIYYLSYNQGNFQFYKTNPVQSSSTYTKPTPTFGVSSFGTNSISSTIGVGGVDKGTSFDNVLIQDVLTNILYPEQLGNINTFSLQGPSGSITNLEVGDSLSPGSYTFSWTLLNSTSFTSNTSKVEDLTYVTITDAYWNTGVGLLGSGLTNSTPFKWVLSTTISSTSPRVYSDSRLFNLSIKRDNGTVISKPLNVEWRWRVYYGSSTFSSLTASGIRSLNSELSPVMGDNLLSYNYVVGGSGYKYIAIGDGVANFSDITYKNLPIALAGVDESYIYDDGSGNNYQKVTVINDFGALTDYRVYRSMNQIDGTMSVYLKV
jgi:hypothetical protein